MEESFPILIAEDDENDALILKRALRKAGFNNAFHVSKDGADVVSYMRGEAPYGDREKYRFPRILITDLKMPRMDGFELLEWIQSHPQCSLIPRLVLSASNQQADVQRAYRLGANSYLMKPSSFERLVEMLQTILQYWQMCQLPALPPKC